MICLWDYICTKQRAYIPIIQYQRPQKSMHKIGMVYVNGNPYSISLKRHILKIQALQYLGIKILSYKNVQRIEIHVQIRTNINW